MIFNQKYYKFSKVTLGAIFLVIIAGSIVRMTNSGMGCPDWPKCFGMWIPPTDINQLPENYQEIYKDRGYDSNTFNVLHTWTEYINRLIGAFAGFLTLILLAYSIFIKRNILILLSSLVVFFMGVQAWLGSVVVESVLDPVKISIHMLMAMFIIFLMMLIVNIVSPAKKNIKRNKKFLYVLIALAFLSIFEILLGTQVRESIDIIAKGYNFNLRELWISDLGKKFEIHRLLSLIIGLMSIILAYLSKKNNLFVKQTIGILLFIIIQILLGIIMTYINIPRLAQPLHLLCGLVLFFLQIDVLIKYFFPKLENE